MKVKPKANCRECHGSGIVSGDWVDYGSTQVQLPDFYCECVMEQLEDSDEEIDIVYELEEE